jgi:hypothetical protein
MFGLYGYSDMGLEDNQENNFFQEKRRNIRTHVAMKQSVAFSCCDSQKRMFVRQKMRQNPLLEKWAFFDKSN